MARFVKYNWLVDGGTSVCNVQALTGAGNLVLNDGALVSIIAGGSSRNLAITSTVDLSALSFVITGIQNGVVSTEGPVIGPNANTVYSTKIYDIITNIAVSGAATNVSVGLGLLGYFPLIKVNPDISPIYGGPFWALSVTSLPVNRLDCLVYQTLDEIYNNGKSFQVMVDPTALQVFPVPVQANSNIILQSASYPSGGLDTNNSLYCTNEILIHVTATAGATGTLIFRQT